MMADLPSVLLFDNRSRRWLSFQNPRRILQVFRLEDVLTTLTAIEQEGQNEELWAAGFISYEASGAFDPALVTHAPTPTLPLLWFGLFPAPVEVQLPAARKTTTTLSFSPSFSHEQYRSAFTRIKELIRTGDTYQVNFTMRMRGQYAGDDLSPFQELLTPCGYPAYIDTGRQIICSTSPELFFELDGETLRSKPMKGTSARGRHLREDEQNAQRLRESEKERAENVMIVDMMRNDISRIALVGSVNATELFTVERYPTVLQMTSTVSCKTYAPLCEILSALFPCASITGAPKVRTMEIIKEVEGTPRGVYTGTIGYIAPHKKIRRAQFNVAIRTLVLDKVSRQVEYGVGGGIVWDSDSRKEYEECLLKAQAVTAPSTPFSLLEALLFIPEGGYPFIENHLARLKNSALYFCYPFDEARVRAQLQELTLMSPHKTRLILSRNGELKVEAIPVSPPALSLGADAPRITGTLSTTPVQSSDIFLFHKTTCRTVYDRAKRAHPTSDEVLLWNERNEVTEFCSANVLMLLDGALVTPPVECGLLAGVFRESLLKQRLIRERIIHLEDLARAETIWAINAVRGFQKVELRRVEEDYLKDQQDDGDFVKTRQ